MTIDRISAIEHSIETNRSGPLRRVTDISATSYGGFYEVLECGHLGRLFFNRANAESSFERKKRRRCPCCKGEPDTTSKKG